MKLLIAFILCFFISFANDFKNIKTFQASFSQSIINKSGKEIIYTGYLYIKHPSSILWEYNEPIKKYVYINNIHVTIIEPDLEQAIISNLEKEINLIKLLKDSKQLSENIYEAEMYSTKYTITVVDNIFEKIEYKDELDNKITINFTNIKQNKEITDEIFKFTIPFEYDTIRK